MLSELVEEEMMLERTHERFQKPLLGNHDGWDDSYSRNDKADPYSSTSLPYCPRPQCQYAYTSSVRQKNLGFWK